MKNISKNHSQPTDGDKRSKPDWALFIGRFQPFHLGHERVVRAGLAQVERVLLLIGSSNRARSTRDPWTFEEREHDSLRIFRERERASDRRTFAGRALLRTGMA
jgi:cytidyltransferase-like protein